MTVLNTQQQEAVEAGEGPVAVIAGPGTGKTKTLTERIMYLIDSGKATSTAILALTFTKKAAEEMRERVSSIVADRQPAVSLPKITTFHALCNELLGDERPFVNDTQRLQIIKSLARPKELKGLSVRELGLLISRAKNSTSIEDANMAKAVRAYNKALTEQNMRDFDDLLFDTYTLLLNDEKARHAAQERFMYILVDEFQDTNRLQYELLKLLSGHDNLFVIGDPNQSIYGFRGASGAVFRQFKADFPTVKRITLTANYRSASAIVRLSNALFPKATPLVAQNTFSGQVRAVQVLNEYGEANWVLAEIQRAIGGGDFLQAVSDDVRSIHRRLSDFAVLYRSRPAALTFQKLLAESGLPYQVVGDGSPYEQPQVQAILALLRSAVTGESIKIEGFGSAEQRLLEAELAKAHSALPSVLVERIIKILGIETNRDMQQFAGALVRFKDLPSAVNYFDTIAEHGFYDATADAITLLTIHASKGLEFPYVFLIGAEEGILPSGRGDEAEERRLFYVAVTRARENLEIIYAKNRGGEKTEQSRFIQGLPEDVLQRYIDPGIDDQLRRIAKRAAKNSQTKLF